MKVLGIFSDWSGCRLYRLAQPFNELKKFEVEISYYCYLPTFPGQNEFELLVNFISRYDLVIVQRCYLLNIWAKIKQACDFVGVPIIFETDDDYINLEQENPAFAGMVGEDFLKSNPTQADINYRRQKSLEEYVTIISQADLVTVSTPELKRTLNIYNKNIEVLENNIEQVYEFRSYDPEHVFIENGGVKMLEKFGFVSIPAYHVTPDQKSAVFTPRIGYTGTPSHRGRDWQSIAGGYRKFIEKYNQKCWFVYTGDPYFNYWHEQQKEEIRKTAKKPFGDRNFAVPAQQYDMYFMNLRNIDIGLAPLDPNLFNMSKSDIKPCELAAWGVPSVLPNYVTYNRHWKHEENCLMYYNDREFAECLEALVNDTNLRMKLGQNALEYIKNNRLEKHHAEKRYNLYQSLIQGSYRLKVHAPSNNQPSLIQQAT